MFEFHLNRKYYKSSKVSPKELTSIHTYDTMGRILHRHTKFLESGLYSETDIEYLVIPKSELDNIIQKAIYENEDFKKIVYQYLKRSFPE